MGQKIRLVGCERYNFRGELYLKGKVYLVGDAKAKIMLRAEDEFGRPYFAPYVAPTKSKEDRVAEAAAKAAAEAARAEVEEVVERPDGSEPDKGAEEAEVDPDAAVEVDTDDDPELDAGDEENPEEVDVDEEDDRDDGKAVEV